MPDWVVVADDLTGALDTAAALAPGGGAAIVLHPVSGWPESAVIAVSTRTRDDDPLAVPHRIGGAVAQAVRRGAPVLLKIDSLLRGPVGPAVRAALDAQRTQRGGGCLAVVAPAFPAMGRFTRQGRVEVPGDPGWDPPDVVAALAAAGLRTRLLGRNEPIPPAGEPGPDAVVVDCESDEDLRRVAVAAGARRDVLLVGTAGLAAQLAPFRPEDGGTGVPVGGGRALLAIGSRAPAALRQVAAAEASGIRRVPVRDAPEDSGRRAGALVALGHVLLVPDAGDDADPTVVAQRLAEAVAEAVEAAEVLVLSGGHVAETVLDRLGVPLLGLGLAELEPGVVASRMPGRTQLLVTKAGAFGDDGALLRLLRDTPSPTLEGSAS